MKTIALLLLALLAATLPILRAADPDTRLTESDWQGIRAAYEAGRHAFRPADDGWRAHNPGQQWTAKFDGRGFVVEPQGAEWRWGLELTDYGFGDVRHPLASGSATHFADGQRLSCERDAAVEEWWVNDRRGLEHGFTIRRQPDDGDRSRDSMPSPRDPLRFTLTVRGTLRPQVAEDALGVRFCDGSGATVITYTGLKAWDADGNALVCRFADGPDGLHLLVDERGARYPLTIDPVAQQAQLKTPDERFNLSQTGDNFGFAVAVSGDTVVVGATLEDSGVSGVNGLPDKSAADSGAAYVFVRSANRWSQQAFLKADQVTAGDEFGAAVAISGDTIVVGAPGEDGSLQGVNAQHNENAANAGAAWVFVRNGTTWSQQAFLKSRQVTAQDRFGTSVAVSGDTVVVGAPLEDGSSTGVNKTVNENAASAGAAWVFVRSGTDWFQQAYLKAGQVTARDEFGTSVAISGDTVVVGSPREDGSAAGINGTPNESSTDSGAVWVFTRSESDWSQEAYLKAGQVSNDDRFGFAVAVAGDTVVVGAPSENGSATGVNGTPNEAATDAGAAWVFVRSGTDWTQQAYLKAGQVTGQVTNGDQFGFAVAAAGDTIVVGAPFEDSSSAGVNSIPDESADNTGATFVFVRSGTTWTQQAYLKAAAVTSDDRFGIAVAVSGETVVVGHHGEDGSATGSNGPVNESAPGAGAAGIFTRSGGNWTQQSYLKPAGSIRGDGFGFSVAISGDTAVVGARGDDGSSTGVNGPPDHGATDSGAARVFTRSGGVWSMQAYLKPGAVGTTQAGDEFGFSVAISGDTIVVGAPFEDSSSTGVNSTPNESQASAGAAYVFIRNGGTWTQQAYLKPAAVGTTQSGDEFGYAVSISGNTVVVGAPFESSGSTGVNSTPDETGLQAGAAYVFTRTGGIWTQQAYLKPAAVGTTQSTDLFGLSVSIDGDTLVAGAPFEDSGSTGVNGTPDESAANAGAAYVFTRSGLKWTQQAYLKPAVVGATQSGDQFGRAVAVSGDTIAIGAPREDSATAGTIGFPDELAANSGAVTVFTRSGTAWTQQVYLKPSDVGATGAQDHFGSSLALDGNSLAVGAPNEDSGTTGVISSPDDVDPNFDSGAAYVFLRIGTTWHQRLYLKSPEAAAVQAGDEFGHAVALSGGTMLVGAPLEDGGSPGSGGIAGEVDPAFNSGAVNIFTISGIIVHQPVGTGLSPGISAIDFGATPQGHSSPTKTFTIANAGPGAVALSGVAATGGNAGDFVVNTSGMAASLAFNASTTFAVAFKPSAAGSRSTTLRISTDEPGAGAFDIALSGIGLSFAADTDGDGLNDASEAQLAALGFLPEVSQPDLVSALFSNTDGLLPNLNQAGYFTAAQVQAMHIDVPLIRRDPATGRFILTLGLQKSTTLAPGSFQPFPFTSPGSTINGAGQIEFEFPSPDNAAFFRLEPR